MSPACPYRDSAQNYTVHTFFECERLNEDRGKLEREVGPLIPDNIFEMMLSGNSHWHGIASFVEGVLKTKKRETQ